ncbi:MAG: S41 family peptidase [Desulfobacterota bacterium]|nr:S41 family peptidase [Thermodesulfobacteriota bacterium]MDW8001513.1 S41 family peptidase [Deltaproteobacteria bacterium]
MNRKIKILFSSSLIVIFLLGFILGAHGKRTERPAEKEEIYEYLKTFSHVIELVKKNYVEDVKDRDIVYSAIKGILGSLDPHSAFLDPETYKEMQSETKGEFGGIGIEITIKDGLPTVITAIEDTPASKAGLQPGDHILRIDGKSTKNMGLMEVVRLIRGEKGKPVTLTIMREGFTSPKDITIVRDIIRVKSVKHRLIEKEYGYIKITQFQERTLEDLRKAINELTKSSGGIKGLVLDLRNNPGGLLDQAVSVADEFLKEGLIVSIEGRNRESKMRFFAEKEDAYLGPLVVLVNEGSASASEIVAGALQDHKRAIIVGTKTFGKGSVQTIFPLGDGSAVKLTTAKYFTPKGRSIQKEGITPDITIEKDIGRIRSQDRKDKDVRRQEDDSKEDQEDFQLYMAMQILKSWDSLRGK